MYSRSTGEVNSNRVTSSLLRKRTRLPIHTHEVRALTFEVTDNFGSSVVLPCGAYGPKSGNVIFQVLQNAPVRTSSLRNPHVIIWKFGRWLRGSDTTVSPVDRRVDVQPSVTLDSLSRYEKLDNSNSGVRHLKEL